MRLQLVVVAVVLGLLAGCGGRQSERPVRPPPAAAPSTDAAQLVAALRHGGYVLFLRHAQAEPGNDPSRVVLEDCATQRGLSRYGRDQAAAIAAALARLGIPIGAVRSSPYCRCADTARLAFGQMVLDDDLLPLRDGGGAARLEAVRRLLATPPLPGRNTALVGHADTIARLVGGAEVHEGEMVIFRPAPGGGSFTVYGRVTAEQLAALAGGTVAQRPPR